MRNNPQPNVVGSSPAEKHYGMERASRVRGASESNRFYVIAALDRRRGIGHNGSLPWHIPSDLQYFHEMTAKYDGDRQGVQNAVIMGRKTWDSIPTGPTGSRPLERRINVVISRNPFLFAPAHPCSSLPVPSTPPEGMHSRTCPRRIVMPEGVILCHSFDDALRQAWHKPAPHVFIIGGAEIYAMAIKHPACCRLYLTQIDAQFRCDTFFPEYEDSFELSSAGPTQEYEGIRFRFCEFQRK